MPLWIGWLINLSCRDVCPTFWPACLFMAYGLCAYLQINTQLNIRLPRNVKCEVGFLSREIDKCDLLSFVYDVQEYRPKCLLHHVKLYQCLRLLHWPHLNLHIRQFNLQVNQLSSCSHAKGTVFWEGSPQAAKSWGQRGLLKPWGCKVS